MIRPASAADVPAVLPLVRAICDLHAARDPDRFVVVDDILARYAAWLPERAADPTSVFFVAEAPGPDGAATVVGYCVGTCEPAAPIFWVPACGWIHDVFVLPDHRRRGLARALVLAAEARFRALGVSQVRLHTGAFNEQARAAFAAQGYRPSVVEMLKTLDQPPPPAEEPPR